MRVVVRAGRPRARARVRRPSPSLNSRIRMERIRREAPFLNSRGFFPIDPRLERWRGFYKGYRVEIRFPRGYPMVPPEWVWLDVPPFEHVTLNSKGEHILCLDILLNKEKWHPGMEIREIFELLDERPESRNLTQTQISRWFFGI